MSARWVAHAGVMGYDGVGAYGLGVRGGYVKRRMGAIHNPKYARR